MKSAREAVDEERRKLPEIVVEDSVGAVPKTRTPLPVSSEIAEMRLAEVSPFASSEAALLLYEKKPWSPFAIMEAVRAFPSTVQIVPLQVNEPKSSLANSVTLILAPNGLLPVMPKLEVATH